VWSRTHKLFIHNEHEEGLDPFSKKEEEEGLDLCKKSYFVSLSRTDPN
jgi:hypothetical protein